MSIWMWMLLCGFGTIFVALVMVLSWGFTLIGIDRPRLVALLSALWLLILWPFAFLRSFKE